MQTTATNDIDWIVLSLERTPERLARFGASNGHLGLPIETVAATDGLEVNRDELAQLDLIIPEHMDGWDDAAIGNALSHWLCWYQVVDTQRPTCIFEDSAFLRHDFVPRALGLVDALPPGWDLVQLGYNTDSVIEFEISPDCHFRGRFEGSFTSAADLQTFARVTDAVAPMRLHNAFGSFAYIVTPSGAQKLIDECFPLASRNVSVPALKRPMKAQTIDAMMNRYFPSLQAYVCFPPIALPARENHVASSGAEAPPTSYWFGKQP